MATVIGLGVQFTANASGMTKGLTEADRAIRNLANQASSAARLFDTFAVSSEAAAKTQQQVATDIAFLGSAFRTGQVSAEEYATELKAIVTAANTAAQAFAEGARITQQVATAEEKRASTLARLSELLQQGAISQQTYERAAADASGANEAAAKAEAARAQALARAASITQANLNPQQKYDQEVLELNQHLQAGRITQETYNSALQKAAQQFANATVAAAQYDNAADAAGTGNNLAFNELSGILAALPGPIGNVGGRLSGLASAGEGLGRVFSGGLTHGFDRLAASAAGLINPLTVSVASVVGFGLAAQQVVAGLAELEGRVERLGFAAEQLGTDFSTIQTLEEAAKRTGVSFETLTTGLQRFAVKLNESRDSSSDTAKALQQLGISQEELIGLSLPAAADRVATALAGVQDPATRAALQLALLGKSGEDVRRGFSAIEESNTALDRFNARISDIDKTRIEDLGRAFDDVKTAIAGLSQNALIPFAQSFADAAVIISRAIGLLNRNIPQFSRVVIDGVAPGLNTLGDALAFVRGRLEAVESQAGTTATALGNVQPLSDEALSIGQPEGFANFEQAVRGSRDLLKNAINEAAALGEVGYAAANQFREALIELQRQAEQGVFQDESYKQELERITAIYRNQIDTIKESQAEERKRAEEIRKAADAAIEADRRRADSALERLRIEQEFGGDTQRAQAAENVLAIENEISRVEEQRRDAIAANQRAEADAASARLAQLDQALAKERDIASGAAAKRREAIELEKQLEQAEERKEQRIADLQARLFERQAEQQLDRIDELSRRSGQALQGNDIRTGEGIAQFLALATGREDPAIDEYRKQLRELENIRREIGKAAAAPVEIAG